MKKLIFILIVFGLVPLGYADSETITCYKDNYKGNFFKCSDADINNFEKWTYKLTEDKDYYYISSQGYYLKPIPKEGKHIFKLNYIGWEFEIEKLSPLLVRNSINNKLLIPINSIKFNYIEPTITDSNGTFINILNNTQLLNAEYPLKVLDPWIVNFTGGWNSTFIQTNLDENESIIIDWNHTIYEPYIMYLTMNSFNTTTIFDENTTNYNNATITGTIDSIGWRNRSRNFDGNDYMTIPDSASMRLMDGSTANYTVSFWIKTTATGGSVFIGDTIFERRQTAISDQWVLHIYLNDNNATGVYIREAGVIPAIDDTTIINDGNWHHILVMRNNTNFVRIYVDGNLSKSGVSILNPSTPEITTIGTRRNNVGAITTPYFDGDIDEFIIIPKILNNSEIFRIYNNSYYSSGNLTTNEHNIIEDEYVLHEVSVNFILDGDSSINLFVNDTSTGIIELLENEIVSGTYYSSIINPENFTIITELINGSTPHIFQINTQEILNRNITITMSDLNLNSYNIPILNRLITGENKLLVYENNIYINTITTDEQVILNSLNSYSFNFKPSKSGTLSNWSAFLDLIATYYQVIISIIVILFFLLLIKGKKFKRRW